jgi:cytochrome c
MTFAGLGKPEDRAAMILYLNSQGSNLPLPAPPPPAEDAAPEGDEAQAATVGEEEAPAEGNAAPAEAAAAAE